MDGCEYSIEIIIITLKERMTEANTFGNKNTTAEKITQTMDNCNISLLNKYSILRRINACYLFRDKSRYLTPKEGWL